MAFVSHSPLPSQPENFVIEKDFLWQQRYSIQSAEISEYLDTPDVIWPIGYHTQNGQNDRVPHPEIIAGKITIPQSLYLIMPENLSIIVTENMDGKKRLKAKFIYNQQTYILAITDPQIWVIYGRNPIGQYEVESVNGLCLSLGEPYKGFCYKLVAAIL